jgi:hypothetical protein
VFFGIVRHLRRKQAAPVAAPKAEIDDPNSL